MKRMRGFGKFHITHLNNQSDVNIPHFRRILLPQICYKFFIIDLHAVRQHDFEPEKLSYEFLSSSLDCFAFLLTFFSSP